MKGNKLAIAVILALIVCLVLIPTCAFADEGVDDAPVVEQGEQVGGQPEQQPSEPENPTQSEEPDEQEPGEQEPEQPIPDDPAEPSEEEESSDVPGEGENDSAGVEVSTGIASLEGESGAPAAGGSASIGDVIYSTVQDAINSATNGETTTITFVENVEENITIGEGQNIILNLNGKTLTNRTAASTITNNGSLRIEGEGTVVNNSELHAIQNNGSLTIDGGTYISKGIGAVIYNVGNATINAGTFTTKSDDYNNALIVNEGYLDIAEGTFRSRNKPVLFNIGLTDIHAEGSEFTNESGALIANGYDSSSKQPNSGWITISNGTFKAGKDGKGILFGQAGSENGGQVTMFYGNFNGKIIRMNYTIGIGGIHSDASVLDFAGENDLILETDGLYYVNFGAAPYVGLNPDIVSAAKAGQPITVHSVREGFHTYTDVPAGAVIVNVCGQSIFINGVEVKNGETYTVPAPASAPAATEPAQPAAKADDKLVEAKSDSSDNQATVTIEGTTAKITVSDSNGDAVAPQEVTIKSVSALEESGVTEASIQLDTNLVIDLDIATVKNASSSEVVTVLNENNVVTIKSGDKELVSVDVKPLLDDAGQQVTVKYSENSLKVVYGGEVVFDVDLSDLEVSGEKLTVKLENGMLKIYDSNGNLLKEIEKA